MKQVIVVRTDLNMRKGKMAAQVAHASMMFLVEAVTENRKLSDAEYDWVNGNFKKIVVGVDSLNELLKVTSVARYAGLTANLCIDSGLTEFHGNPTPTCVAIGPDVEHRIDFVTGKLKLL